MDITGLELIGVGTTRLMSMDLNLIADTSRATKAFPGAAINARTFVDAGNTDRVIGEAIEVVLDGAYAFGEDAENIKGFKFVRRGGERYYIAEVKLAERETPQGKIKERLQPCRSWISVQDRLPDDGSIVMFYHTGDYGKRGTQSSMHVGAAFRDGTFEDANGIFTSGVTHWMPLPESPRNTYEANYFKLDGSNPVRETKPLECYTYISNTMPRKYSLHFPRLEYYVEISKQQYDEIVERQEGGE